MVDCPTPGTIVEAGVNRVLDTYRESPNLLGLLRAYLQQVEEAIGDVCVIPDYFDLDTAIGDQLTLLGKRLGFPRCHCVCTVSPVFGFTCGGSYSGPFEIVGLCEGGTWINCRDTATSTICVDDDDVYRAILKVRRYQALGLYDIESLEASVNTLWGSTAQVINLGGGKVAIVPGRALNAYETMVRSIAFRALPIAPGVKAMASNAVTGIFGFGAGWGGLCDGSEWLCPVDPYVYSCP